jgi:peptide/nickel transport system ATP-binding protein
MNFSGKNEITDEGNGFLIQVSGLKTHFYTTEGVVRAVDDVTLSLRKGDTMGIVGESGCGKSVTALSIMRLVPRPGRIKGGEIWFEGRGNLLDLEETELRKIRGNEISMIFQEPMTSLNPVFQIGFQIAETYRLHQKMSSKEAWERAVEMLKIVGVPSPERRIKDYPHHLSGGMRQRVMIAMALACHPKLMIADEPTTALDVTIQAQILELMNKLKEEVGTSIFLITHNLGIIAEMAQHVSVMYAGVVVEYAGVGPLFAKPTHPYTIGLLQSLPRVDLEGEGEQRLRTIPGAVPSLLDLPPGCRFSDRCVHAYDLCKREEPPLRMIEKDHHVRCWLHEPVSRE